MECLRQRFTAINKYLDDLRIAIQQDKKNMQSQVSTDIHSTKQLWRRAVGNIARNECHMGHGTVVFGRSSKPPRDEFASKEFVQKLITAATDKPTPKTKTVNYVQPMTVSSGTDNDLNVNYWNNGEEVLPLPIRSTFSFSKMAEQIPPNDDRLDCKLSTLCFLHDDICDIGKSINQTFSFQILIFFSYAFLALTAQLYFVYCGLVGQVDTFFHLIIFSS